MNREAGKTVPYWYDSYFALWNTQSASYLSHMVQYRETFVISQSGHCFASIIVLYAELCFEAQYTVTV